MVQSKRSILKELIWCLNMDDDIMDPILPIGDDEEKDIEEGLDLDDAFDDEEA